MHAIVRTKTVTLSKKFFEKNPKIFVNLGFSFALYSGGGSKTNICLPGGNENGKQEKMSDRRGDHGICAVQNRGLSSFFR